MDLVNSMMSISLISFFSEGGCQLGSGIVSLGVHGMELSGNIGTLPNAKSLAFFLTLEDLWISFLGRCTLLFVFCCAGLKLSQISNMGFLLESLNDISISSHHLHHECAMDLDKNKK